MSNNLGITQLTTNQNNKENTINNADGRLDAALTETLSKALSGSNPSVTITSGELQQAQYITLSDGTTPSGVATIDIPAIKRGTFFVRNASSIPADVGISGQSATKPRIAAGSWRLLVSDGSNVRQVDGSEALGWPFDVGIFFPGVMDNDQLIVRYVFTRTVSFPTNAAGSFADAVGSATASTDIDIQRNGMSIGTLNFGMGMDTGTFTLTATTFAAGDVLSLHGPMTADASLADVAITLKGVRA